MQTHVSYVGFFFIQEDTETAKYVHRLAQLQHRFYKSSKANLRYVKLVLVFLCFCLFVCACLCLCLCMFVFVCVHVHLTIRLKK